MTTAVTDNTATTAVPAAAAPNTPEDATGYTQMSTAFDELTAPATTAAKEPVDTVTSPAALEAAAAAVKAEAATTAGTTEASTTGTTEAPATGTTEAPATGTTDAPATGTTDVPVDKDWKAEYEKLLAQKPAPGETAKPADATPASAPAAAAPAEIYTAEEKEVLKAHTENWTEVSRGEALVRRGEYQRLLAHVFSEVKRVYDPLVQRALQTADHVESSEMVTEIRRGHADYSDKLHDQVVAWAGTLQGMKRKVAESIIEEGSPEEVVDLITEFKTATGKTTPAAGTAPAATAKPATNNVTDITEAAKKAAKAMGVVEGKRTATVAVDDPNDFDSTWKAITADGAK